MIVVIGMSVVALAILLIATHGFGAWSKEDEGITLYGNVDIRQVDLGFRVSGRIAEMPVDEGAHVKAGDRLAVLDAGPLKDRLAAATAQMELAEADLDKRHNGNRPQDIAQARAALAQQQANLAKAREDYERRKPLIDSGAISRALFDETVAALRAAEAQVNAATQALSLQQAGSRKEDIAAAAAQVASARAQRASAATDRQDATLVAPSDGTILTRAREPGAIVQPGETVFALTIDRPVRIRAYVPEPDLGRLTPGMNVNVRVDGNGRVYHGTIGYISPTAEFTPKTVETENLRSDLVYRLRVILSDADNGLRQGQPVTVTIPGARPAAKR
jgi:HlyD family secretion protein